MRHILQKAGKSRKYIPNAQQLKQRIWLPIVVRQALSTNLPPHWSLTLSEVLYEDKDGRVIRVVKVRQARCPLDEK